MLPRSSCNTLPVNRQFRTLAFASLNPTGIGLYCTTYCVQYKEQLETRNPALTKRMKKTKEAQLGEEYGTKLSLNQCGPGWNGGILRLFVENLPSELKPVGCVILLRTW
jgi:hypothetical protein